MSEERDSYGTGEDFQRVKAGYKEGFVKREESARLGQSEDCEPKTAEEVNLIRRIENCTKDLIGGLNAIEGQTFALNKNLLPEKPKDDSKVGVGQTPPQGWLECHLADLDHLIWQSKQIMDEVNRLVQATKIKN